MPNTPIDIRAIPLDLIDVPQVQRLRMSRDDPGLDDLARSLMRHGVLNPITVRAQGERYELLAGSRRLRAAALNNWPEIAANVIPADESAARDVTLIENIQRLDLTPIEQAVALQGIIDADDPPIEELRRRVGKSESWINDRLALLTWPDHLQQAVHHGKLSLAVANILSRIPDPDVRETLVLQAIQNGITANTASLWLQQHQAQAPVPPNQAAPLPAAPQVLPTFETRPICACCNTPTEPGQISTVNMCPECVGAMNAAAQAAAQR